MATSYTPLLRLPVMTPGDPSVANSWGAVLDAMIPLLDASICGIGAVSLTGETAVTLTTANNASDQARPMVVQFTGSPTAPVTVTIPGLSRIQMFQNQTTQPVVLTTGAGGSATTVTVQPADLVMAWCDGTNVNLVNSMLGQTCTPTLALIGSAGTSGTWTVPAGVYFLRSVLVIGGGGPGGCNQPGYCGAGGGAGGAALGPMSVTPGQSIAWQVGNGGTVGSPTSIGIGGGETIFGAFTAQGGACGVSGNSSGSIAGGAPGVASGAAFTQTGGYGNDGNSTGAPTGIGGSSYLGGGGRCGSGNGLPGTSFGSGGGGSYGAVTGYGAIGQEGLIMAQYDVYA